MIINLLDTLPEINYNNHEVYQCSLQSPQKENSNRTGKQLVLGDNYYFRFSEGDSKNNIYHLKNNGIDFNAYTCFPYYYDVDTGFVAIENFLKYVNNDFVLVFIDNDDKNQEKLFGEIFKDKVKYCRPGCSHSVTFPFNIINTILKDGGRYDYPFIGDRGIIYNQINFIYENINILTNLLNNMTEIVDQEEYIRKCIGLNINYIYNKEEIAKSFIFIIDEFLKRYTFFKNYIEFDYKKSTNDVNKLFRFTNELFYCFSLLQKYTLRPTWDDKGQIFFTKDSHITTYINNIKNLQRQMKNNIQIVTSSV